jgi:hypothetical protein
MASQRSLVRVLVLCLLCGACAAAKRRRYLSVSMDEELLRSKQAHLDRPPWKKSGTDHDRTIIHLKLPHPSARITNVLAEFSCTRKIFRSTVTLLFVLDN